MDAELISVVVPVYNMGKYVGRAVERLLDQDHPAYEIILVDDGSTDGSGPICDGLARENGRVRVVHQANGGLSAARNRGIDEARGAYIIFPDPDDWVERDYLSGLTAQRKNGADLEICGFYLTEPDRETAHDADGGPLLLTRAEALDSVMRADRYCGFAWNKLYHMDVIRRHGLRFDTELGMAQDLHFAFRYILCCGQVSYDPRPLYHYFQHEGGVTNIRAGLTPRKLSGLRAYEKIAELAGDDYPEVRAQARATLANMSLQFLYICRGSETKDPAVYRDVLGKLRGNLGHMLRSGRFSAGRKLLALVGAVLPSVSYAIWRRKERG